MALFGVDWDDELHVRESFGDWLLLEADGVAGAGDIYLEPISLVRDLRVVTPLFFSAGTRGGFRVFTAAVFEYNSSFALGDIGGFFITYNLRTEFTGFHLHYHIQTTRTTNGSKRRSFLSLV